MNLLKLPKYKDKETLKKKLTYAVMSGAGFELSQGKDLFNRFSFKMILLGLYYLNEAYVSTPSLTQSWRPSPLVSSDRPSSSCPSSSLALSSTLPQRSPSLPQPSSPPARKCSPQGPGTEHNLGGVRFVEKPVSRRRTSSPVQSRWS